MTQVILIREPYLRNLSWYDRSPQRAVQRAASLAVLHSSPYRVDSQGNYVVKASEYYKN
jgi:hypothetical protein